jgi:hypothetical protein
MQPDWGISFSLKYAREMGVNPRRCLEAALKDLGFRRLRLMSYWDEHEKEQGTYDFTELDWQFDLAKKYKARVSLCIGLRQPRWPESHWAQWALGLPKEEWQQALERYIAAVVKRYKGHPCLENWQLENEALNRSFGANGNFDRMRLRAELAMVKHLDPAHPVIMSTSNTWGLPLRRPRPDKFGFSMYRYQYKRGMYTHSRLPAWFYRVRGSVIRILTRRPIFIHELQAEPWGPRATAKLSATEQAQSMTPERIRQAMEFATQTGLMPAYLWGVEWWYWLKVTQHKPEAWETVKSQLRSHTS